MKLFREFKRLLNLEPRYEPVNRLEILLRDAALNPGVRPVISRMLFHFDLYALCAAKSVQAADPETLGLVTVDFKSVPHFMAFTSQEAFAYYLRRSRTQQVGYVRMAAFDLFKALHATGKPLAVHAGEFGKTYTAYEMQMLVEGTHDVEREDLVLGTQVIIGQPAEMPLPLLRALISLCDHDKRVSEILFGQIVIPGHSKPGPSFLAAATFAEGVDEEDQREFARDVDIAVRGVMPPNRDIVISRQFSRSEGLLPVRDALIAAESGR